jgi:hypothetical protein
MISPHLAPDPVDVAPWDAASVAHLPRSERQAAYFVWHKHTKRICARTGVPMPVRLKRSKATSQDERQRRLKERNAISRAKRVDAKRAYWVKYYAKRHLVLLEKVKARREADPIAFKKTSGAWRDANRQKLNASQRTTEARVRHQKYHAIKQTTDPSYRVRRYLRKTLWYCLKVYSQVGASKSASALGLVGCSIPDLIRHIEAQWTPGMSWDNYSFRGWHIDHIRPCASFDFSNPSEQKKCFHFTNLQPLWATDNHKKSASLTWQKQEAIAA